MKTVETYLTPQDLAQNFSDFHAVDLVQFLAMYSSEELAQFCSLISKHQLAAIIEQSDLNLLLRIVQQLSIENLLKVFSYMSKDDVADMLGELPIALRKSLLNKMKENDRVILTSLLGYPNDSAGGLMTTEYIALNENLCVRQALNKIKEIAPKTEIITIIYLLNNQKQLVGTVNLRDLFTHQEEKLLKDFKNPNVLKVYPEEDQEQVSLLVSKYDLLAIPVVNHRDLLLGIITVDDIIDVIIDEQTEDLLGLAGVDKEERLNAPLIDSVKKRLPWLVINLATAFMASFTIGLFEGTIEKVVALASVMSIVAGMGGNAGTQTLSLVIRGIALGEVKLKEDWRLIIKEFCLGIINGAITGFITAIIIYWHYHNIFLGVIILIAMMGNLVIAGVFGFTIPLVLKKLNIDPALASSIFLTTMTDVGGFFIFLGLAQLFLAYLI
ncbi:MAG TPA: magnesium transporter [Enterococcus columbae]|nr:magnesium transporter [Enterococcus columbae]